MGKHIGSSLREWRISELTAKQKPYFIDEEHAPRLTIGAGQEMTILTGLHGENLMTARSNITTIPMRTLPYEQLGIVQEGNLKLQIGYEQRVLRASDV